MRVAHTLVWIQYNLVSDGASMVHLFGFHLRWFSLNCQFLR